MKRLAEVNLSTWFHRKARKPLVLRGARQVGKSTLVRMFAKNEKLDLVEINFETESFRTLKNEDLNLANFISEIETKKNITLTKKSLIFLDEIQKSPTAFMMLRYFYENRPDIAVIAAGSLLEFLFENETISVPVGRIEYLYLGPMNFEEFLMATQAEKLLERLRHQKYQIQESQIDLLNKKLNEFLFVGGMPEAVKTFVNEKSFNRVRAIQNSILQTYEDDFPKYAKKGSFERLAFVFSRLHDFVGKKIKYSEITQDYQSKELRACIELLEKARVVIRCFHSSLEKLSIYGSQDFHTFKVYYLDVGLLCAKLKISMENIFEMSDLDSSAKGIVYEQFVSQHLAYANLEESPALQYWLRDKKSQGAEVDFVIQKNQQIIPIEVKSGKNGKLRSLNQLMGEKNLTLAVKLSAGTPDSAWFKARPVEKLSAKFINNQKVESVSFKLLTLHLSQAAWLNQILDS